MATKTIAINGFDLVSSWSYAHYTWNIEEGRAWWFGPSSPSTGAKTVSVDLSSIPSGSRVTSAILRARTNGAGDSHASANGISVNITNDKTSGVNVTSWFSTLMTQLSIKFTFKAYDSEAPSPSTSSSGSRTCTFSSLELVLAYELPTSTGTLDKTSVAAGSSITLTITPANTNYTHRIVWTLPGATTATTHTDTHPASGTTTNLTDTWTVNASYVDAIPNATSKRAFVKLITYNASNQEVGNVEYSFTVTVPSSIKPSIASGGGISMTDYQSPNQWTELVQGYSTATLQLSGVTPAAGSTISSVVFTGWGGSANGTLNNGNYVANTGTLNSGGFKTVTAVVTDSRGRTLTVTSASNLLAVRSYSAPSITSVTAKRCDENGNLSEMGTYVRVAANYIYSRVNDDTHSTYLNTVSSNVKYKITTVSGYTDSGLELSGGTVTVVSNIKNNVSGAYVIIGAPTTGQTGGQISGDSSYHIQLTITDALDNKATAVVTLPTTTYVLHFRNGGNAVGVGRAAMSTDNTFAVNDNWDVYAGKINVSKLPLHLQVTRAAVSDDDVNNYTVAGTYLIQSSDVAATMHNLPLQKSGEIIVGHARQDERTSTIAGSTYCCMYQMFIAYDLTTTSAANSKIQCYLRTMLTLGTAGTVTFGAWKKLAYSEDITANDLTGTLPVAHGGTGSKVKNFTNNILIPSASTSLTYSLPANASYVGYVTNGGKDLVFTIPLGRDIDDNVQSVSISGNCYLHGPSGKFEGSSSNNNLVDITSFDSLSTTLTKAGGIIVVKISKTSGSFGATNNAVICVHSDSLQLTFSTTQ